MNTRLVDHNIKEEIRINGPEYLLNVKKMYGDNVYLNSSEAGLTECKDYLFAFSPEFANQIYIKQYKNFIKSGGWHIIRKALGNGLLTSEEPIHLKHRKILNSAFHVNKIDSYLHKSLLIIKEETDKWLDKEHVDISDEMFSLSYKVLTNTIFNDDMLEESDDLKTIFFQILQKTSHGEYSSPSNFQEISEKLNTLMLKVIKTRIENEREEKDFIDLLIMASIENENISLQDISDEVITMLLAGHETTANTLSWCIAHMTQDKDYWDLLMEESGKIDYEGSLVHCIKDWDVSKFAINEALRLYPPVWFSPRKAIVDTIVGDFLIKAGTNVILSSFVTHRNDQYFNDPNSFIPTRWAGGLEESLPEGAYFPFHLGPRKCIGYQFAMAQAQMTIVEMASKMRIELVGDFPKGLPIATYRPKGKVTVKILKRNNKDNSRNSMG
jgi:cytochrome P450